MKTYSFPRGGIFLEDATVPAGDDFTVAFLPVLSIIPLARRPGRTARALVSVGDMVREGMLVGTGEGGSANVHAAVPGRVVDKIDWDDGEGRSCSGLLVRTEGDFDRLGTNKEEALPEVFPEGPDYEKLCRVLDECGIVQMEGSGRMLSRILAEFLDSPKNDSPKDGPEDTLVVRCVFDDPWLAADRVLCARRPDAVVGGAAFIAAALPGIKRLVFAVSRNAVDLGRTLLEQGRRGGIPCGLVVTGDRYPQRNRRELELILDRYGREERLDLGKFLVLGPATLAAAYDAVRFRRPILERYVAIGGSAVLNPGVFRARIGLRIGDLFKECGGFVPGDRHIVSGSPFFGEKVLNLNEPVTKTSFAFAALRESQAGKRKVGDCIACGECSGVCPVGLDPEELYKTAMTSTEGPASHPGFLECHGCACCDAVCPSRIPLADLISGARGDCRG